MRRASIRYVLLSVLLLLCTCLPTSGYGNWDQEREGSVLEAHESWTEETTPGTTPATVPATVPATTPLTVPATAPATAPVTAPARPAAPPAVPATIPPPQVPLAPNQVPAVVAEPPLPPSTPDCTLRLLTVFDWFSVSPTEGIAHYDIRKDMNVAWRAACEFIDATYTWTITGMPGVTTLHSHNITFSSTEFMNLFTGADAATPSKQITISLVISAARTKANIPVNPNPVTLHVVLYQPPQLVAPGTEYVVAPTTPVAFLSDLGLTFHKSAVKFGSYFSVSYALSADATAVRFPFGTFKDTWRVDQPDQTVSLPVPISTAQQNALVAGNVVPPTSLWCYLYVQNDRFIGTYFGPFQVNVDGRTAVTDSAEREQIAEQILTDMFVKDPFAAVEYFLGGLGSALSSAQQTHFLELAYAALDDIVAKEANSPSAPPAQIPDPSDDTLDAIDEARATAIADMPPAVQQRLAESLAALLGTEPSNVSVALASVIRALKVADMLLAVSLAVGTSGMSEAMKTVLSAGIGAVLRLMTSFASSHAGQVPPPPPSSVKTNGKEFTTQGSDSKREFNVQQALDRSIRRAFSALENVAKARVEVDTVTRTTSLCTGAETLSNCYFYSEMVIVDPGQYGTLADKFDGVASTGGLDAHLSSLGHGTLIAMYTGINDPNLFDRTFDPALGVNPVRQYGGNARLELFLPLVGSARLQAGARLPVQVPEASEAPKLVIPGLTQANVPTQFAITVRRSFTDTQWVKTAGTSVVAIDANTIAGSGYRIIDYFWSVAVQPPAPAAEPPAVPGVTPPTSPLLRPSVQPLQPFAPLTPSTRAATSEGGNKGVAIGVGVGVGVGVAILVLLVGIILFVRRRRHDDFVDPEFVVGKDTHFIQPSELENGHFAPPPTPSLGSGTYTPASQRVHV